MPVKSSGSGWNVRLASASVTVAVTAPLILLTIVNVVAVGIVPMKMPAGMPGTCAIGCPGSNPAVLVNVTVALQLVIAPTILIELAGEPTAVNKMASFQSPVVVIANDVPEPENFGNNRMFDMAKPSLSDRNGLRWCRPDCQRVDVVLDRGSEVQKVGLPESVRSICQVIKDEG